MSALKQKLEYGDYQTPAELALSCCRVLAKLGLTPRSLLEPTCGVGGFLKAGVEYFPNAGTARGFEINREYVGDARRAMKKHASRISVAIKHADFFEVNWTAVVNSLPQPLLVIGNPPWVTNSCLESVGSENLPVKSNFQGHVGLDAVTGKGNFDISEYMLIRLSESLQGKEATLAMLCKTAVARKLMAYCWKRGLEMGGCHIFPIDAQRDFGAAVDACLFVASFNGAGKDRSCIVHEDFDLETRCSHLGYRDGLLISDVEKYEQWAFLRGQTAYTWRSGVKHDCAKVMEFTKQDGRLLNGFGKSVEIEDTFLYPLLKSSALASSAKVGKRQVLVTQHTVGEDTATIAQVSPKTWRYLLDHAEWLDKRASIIYKKRPRFSVFGVGDYSFAPWKVVISGFYKKLEFRVFGPSAGRPVMLDDTAYFLSCKQEREARLLADMLNSTPSRELLSSLIFWDAKRPITVDVLRQLSLEKLADHLGSSAALAAASVHRRPQSMSAPV